jgi:DNA-binding NtrC family response regulator
MMSAAWEQLFDLLLVDRDAAFVKALGAQLQPAGFAIHVAPDMDEARSRLAVMSFDFVAVSIHGRRAIDVEALTELADAAESARLVVLLPETHESYEDALRQAGLNHVIARGLPMRQIARYLTAQGEIRHLELQNYRLRQMLDGRTGYEGLIGGSAPMRSLYKLLDQIARTDSPILVSGEDGTERVDVARAIHQKSERAAQPLIVVDCADGVQDPEGSHIFGPPGSGNFASGPNPRNSAFARAGKGTVVLHRIESLAPAAQQRLLDFLHRPFFQNETPSHAKPLARIIVTAGANLLSRVESGEFLRELFYRLNILQARVPPLHERREDIPLLAHHFLRVAGRRAADRAPASYSFSGQALLMMFEYEWPGNVEELRDVVQEIAKRTQGPIIEVNDLPAKLQSATQPAPGSKLNGRNHMPLKEAKRLFESEYFTGLLKHVHGNMTMASRYSHVGRPYLYKKIREYGLEPEEFR